MTKSRKFRFLFHIAVDCRQQRPGSTFTRKKETNPEQLDTEYEAFLADMGMNSGNDKSNPEKPYVPPMGDLSRCFNNQRSAPLMLTNGSSAPGAASAHARAISDPQKAGGLKIMGKSIFGGKLTTMTSGYKTQKELEYEREKKKAEDAYRPVPTEWRVEQIEKGLNASHDNYLGQLERIREQELRAKSAEKDILKANLSLPPPPPPPNNAPASTSKAKKYQPLYSNFVKQASSESKPEEDDGLPKLNYNPWEQFKKS